MLYQVMVRAAPGATWAPFATATSDPFAAMRMIQLANAAHSEVTLLQARDVAALEALLARIQRGEPPSADAAPMPSLSLTPRVSVHDPPIEQRRWEIERGPGGDHDQPYAFELPRDLGTLSAWLRLLARNWREAHRGEAA